MFQLEGQEFLFFIVLSFIELLPLFVSGERGCDAAFELSDLVELASSFSFQLTDLLLQFFLAMFSLQLFSHRKRYSALVKSLIGLIRHFDVVAYSQEQKTPLWLVERHLTDDLVEALAE